MSVSFYLNKIGNKKTLNNFHICHQCRCEYLLEKLGKRPNVMMRCHAENEFLN
jgi:hypothetical protein